MYEGYTQRKLSIRNVNVYTLSLKLLTLIIFNLQANKEGMSCYLQTNERDMLFFDVTHYHFTEWPDHGVSTDKMCMIEFIGHIRKAHPPKGAPLVVHCNAGVGRTGTFIMLDTMLQRLEQEESLNIYDFLLEIRHQRVKLVQTEVSCNIYQV